ncbi:MAG: 4Fe-4S binding protein [Candidatus Eremiobacteraeota bacterium]|nr:4Fe-4S binding protein [Candidatus Eremiobacteraeota bacterium]
MGHLSHVEKEHLLPLVKRLNLYPVGAPESDELYEILSLIYTRETAAIAAKFPLLETTLEELSPRVRKKPGELLPFIEEMAERGIVTESVYGGRAYYMLSPLIIGLFEFIFMKTSQDMPLEKLAALIDAYEKGPLGRQFATLKTKMGRMLPLEKAFPLLSTSVLSFERAGEIISRSEYLSLTRCYCRHKSLHLGRKCSHPFEEVCMAFGKAAEFLVRRGFAQAISINDGLEVLKKAEEENLVHIMDNVRENPAFLCNCCSCCCAFLSFMKRVPGGSTVAPSSVQAEVAMDTCMRCGICLEKCPAGAISIPREESVHIDSVRCLGCGLCAVTCPRQAITLAGRRRRIIPPGNVTEKFARAAFETGKLLPYIPEAVRILLRRFL